MLPSEQIINAVHTIPGVTSGRAGLLSKLKNEQFRVITGERITQKPPITKMFLSTNRQAASLDIYETYILYTYSIWCQGTICASLAVFLILEIIKFSKTFTLSILAACSNYLKKTIKSKLPDSSF